MNTNPALEPFRFVIHQLPGALIWDSPQRCYRLFLGIEPGSSKDEIWITWLICNSTNNPNFSDIAICRWVYSIHESHVFGLYVACAG